MASNTFTAPSDTFQGKRFLVDALVKAKKGGATSSNGKDDPAAVRKVPDDGRIDATVSWIGKDTLNPMGLMQPAAHSPY